MLTHPAVKKLNDFLVICENAGALLGEKFICLNYLKNQILLSEGQIPATIYFIETGSLRMYYFEQGHPITLQFFTAGDWYMPSGIFIGQASSCYVDVLEDSILYGISIVDLISLSEQFSDIQQLIPIMLEHNHSQCQQRNQLLRITSGIKRYQQFIQSNPLLYPKLTQEMMASYLNMTRKHLSRIRTELLFNKKRRAGS